MSTEPERYNIDEMMDRLKSRPAESPAEEEGELVTRADGRQAIKVRKRKRRSRQPHKERRRRMRVLKISAVLILLLGLLLSAGFLTIYVNSSPYRKQIVEDITKASGADVDMQQFRMTPTGANAVTIDLEWPSGNVLQSLSMKTLRADIKLKSFFSGGLAGRELNVHSGKLLMRLPQDGEPLRVGEAVEGMLPIHFDQYSIKDFQLQLLGEHNAIIRLFDSEATFTPLDQEQVPQLRLAKGNLEARHWPVLRLNRAHVEFRGKRADVIGLRVKHLKDDKGMLELSGQLAPYESDQPSILRLDADSFLLSGVIGEELGKFFAGRVDAAPELGVSELRVMFGRKPEATLAMMFRGTMGAAFEMKNFPFLYSLSQILGDEWFSQPQFEDLIRGSVLRRGELIELRDLEFSSKSRMAIRGNLSSEKGKLSGVLQVGIAYGMITTAENRVLEAMFSEPREGYRWITLEISGRSVAPADNFSQLYEKTLKSLKEQDAAETSGL